MNKAGFSLIEVMVSTVLFALILLSASGIFKLVIDSQRRAISSQNVQESLKYFLEVVSKEIRMAKKDTNSACLYLDPSHTFATSSNAFGDMLFLRNYRGQCVSYYLAQDSNGVIRFRIARNLDADYLSPAKIEISALHFVVNEGVNGQPIVTVSLKAQATGDSQYSEPMEIQTSLTSRYYK